MSLFSGRGFKSFLPASTSLALAVVGLGLLFLGLLLGLIYGLSFPSGERLGNFSFVAGFLAAPLAAVLIQIGAWLEERALPRIPLGCTSVLVLAFSALITAVGMFSEKGTGTTAAGTAVLCVGPFLLLFSVVVIVALTKAPAEWRAISQAEHHEQAIELIRAQGGTASYRDLSEKLGVSEERVDKLLRELVENKKLLGFREVQHQFFFTVAAYGKKQLQLLGMVKSRGQVPLDVLATELDVPYGSLQEMIYGLVQSGRFTGYINWDEGQLFSAEAEKMQADQRCPHCGGELGLAGKGVVRCGSCGTEVFLSGGGREASG